MSVHVVCPTCAAVNRVPEDRLAGDHAAARCPKCGGTLFPAAPIDVTAAELERHVARSGLPVVVDFWAAWCGPCRMMAPAYAEAARQMSGRARLLKLDVDAEETAGARYGIRSIPTMVVFRGGREVARHSGAMAAGQIGDWIARAG